MSDWLLDLRFAWRTLRRAPAFTAAAALTLAIGVGATTAVFSVVYAVLLRPLPYPDSERLVRVYSEDEGVLWTASPPDFVDWRGQTTSFEQLAAVNSGAFALTGAGPAQQRQGAQVTAAFFPVLGVAPALGRGFAAAADADGASRLVVLGDALWRTVYGGDRDVLGRTVRLDGAEYEVIGVMPPGFNAPGNTELWVPLMFTADDLATQRGAHYLDVYGRLRAGVTLERADREMKEIAARIGLAFPEVNQGWTARVTSLRDALVGDLRRPLYALLGAVALVLLTACVNVASLLIGRAVARDRELALRAALGAGRGRLARVVLADTAVLALAGGALGVALAAWGVEALTRIAPADLPQLDQARVDGLVLVFSLLVTGLTALLFGAAPSYRLLRRAEDVGALADRERGGTAGRGAQGTRRTLVAVQVALAVTLVAGAGLLVRSLANLLATDAGFEPRGVLSFALAVPDASYQEPERVEAFVVAVEDHLRALPGVTDVGTTFGLPLTGFDFSISVSSLDGRAFSPQEKERFVSPQLRIVTPGYFAAMGIPILRGRGIVDQDRADTPPVVVVSETAARRMFGTNDPIGRRFELGTRMGLGRGRVGGEVVGVVGDVRDVGPGEPPRPLMYAVHRQFPVGFLTVVVKASGGDPLALAGPARAAVAEVDPNVPVYQVRTLRQLMGASVARTRFLATVLALFAGVALVLAAVGIYGVVAYSVAQRTREFGIRLALGARAADVVRLVLGQGAALSAAGAAAGLVLTLIATPVLRRLLYQVTPTDPVTLVGGTLALLVVALVACYLPARRAARLDPMEALHHE